MECLGEEFAIRLGFLMDLSSCAEEESELAQTAHMARVRGLQDRRLDEAQMTKSCYQELGFLLAVTGVAAAV